MKIFCFGANHTAPGSLHETMHFSPGEATPFLAALVQSGVASEAMLLTAPRRTEFYIAADEPTTARDSLLNKLKECNKAPGEAELAKTFTHREEGAVRHLLRVAAGLDAPVAGEVEILHHVRAAHELALNAGTAREIISTLAARAISFAERVRDEPELAGLYLSVISVALRLTSKVFGSLAERTVLLVGTGETGRMLARQFQARGVRRVLAVSPEAALETGGELIGTDALATEGAQADIIIFAKDSAETPVGDLVARIQSRRDHLRIVFDFGGRTNGELANLPAVFFYPLGALEAAARKTRAHGDAAVAQVEELVELEVDRFRRWQSSVEVQKLLETLTSNVEQIRRQQMERYGKNLSEEETRQLEEFTQELLHSVVHDVTGNFKNINIETELGAKEFDLIQSLFNLRSEPREK